MTVENKLKQLIGNQLGVLPETIVNNAHLVNDLGADSLDLVEIVMSIESSFAIAIEDDEYDSADTISKIINLINSKLAVN